VMKYFGPTIFALVSVIPDAFHWCSPEKVHGHTVIALAMVPLIYAFLHSAIRDSWTCLLTAAGAFLVSVGLLATHFGPSLFYGLLCVKVVLVFLFIWCFQVRLSAKTSLA
jgi:hypothetical protein